MGEHFSTQKFAGRSPRSVPVTNADVLNACIDSMLRKYRAALAENTAGVLGAPNVKVMNSFRAAIRRNEKSIALWTSKRLCAHDIVLHSARINSSTYPIIRCSKCKTSATRK